MESLSEAHIWRKGEGPSPRRFYQTAIPFNRQRRGGGKGRNVFSRANFSGRDPKGLRKNKQKRKKKERKKWKQEEEEGEEEPTLPPFLDSSFSAQLLDFLHFHAP